MPRKPPTSPNARNVKQQIIDGAKLGGIVLAGALIFWIFAEGIVSVLHYAFPDKYAQEDKRAVQFGWGHRRLIKEVTKCDKHPGCYVTIKYNWIRGSHWLDQSNIQLESPRRAGEMR